MNIAQKTVRKTKIFLRTHWVKMLIAFIVLALIGLAIWGLMSLESFYQKMTLATLPIQLLMGGVHAVIFVSMYQMFFRGSFGSMGNKKIKSGWVNVKFSDVIGVEEAKEEAMEVVELIRDRKRVEQIGGKIVKGILLVGPPGCGKTLLAKAIASEAGIPFLSTAGSEFTEMFVGVGASRVRSLFRKARTLAYSNGACIIFIDEIDAIGRARQFSAFGGGGETNSTQNQLLIEMDGLGDKREDIIVIAATNSAEGNLDPALLRPGRFDRKIRIDKPYIEGRKALFDYYMSKIKFDKTIETRRLANYTVGKSAADIENIVKEAALIATRDKRDTITQKDISSAIERIDLGLKRKRKIPDRERRNTAYHEAGHAIICYYLNPIDDVFKVSIASRTDTLGVMHYQPLEEVLSEDREYYIAHIMQALGGYAAEKVQFGKTTSGVISDFRKSMEMAHRMVWKLGMGQNGFVGDYSVLVSLERGDFVSESVKDKLTNETHAILKQCMDETEAFLRKEKALLDAMAQALLSQEELEYDDVIDLCQTYGLTEHRKVEEGGLLQSFQEKMGILPPAHTTKEEPPKQQPEE